MLSISQYFTRDGIVGVIFFIGGNIGVAAMIAWLLRQPSYAQPGAMAYLLLAGLSFAALAGLPLMLIGRAYDVELRHLPKELQRSRDQS